MADRLVYYVHLSAEHRRMRTLHDISLDSLDVHLVSGSASHPEPEISESAWITTLKNHSVNSVNAIYTKK